MSYGEKFKDLLKTTAKGFGIGLIISIILAVLMGMSSAGSFIACVLVFTIVIGSIVSIIICSKSGTQGFLSGAVSRLWTGIQALFFGSLLGGSPVLIVFGIIKFFIGLLIMIPVGLYMAISYFFNLIYLGIMCILEKNNLLESREGLCETLDKLVPIISLVVVVVLIIMVLK